MAAPAARTPIVEGPLTREVLAGTDGYWRTNDQDLHVRGYKGEGQYQHPPELAINNEIDRFTLAMDVIKRVPRLQVAGVHVIERLKDLPIECRNDAHKHGIDKPEADDWTWPY